jgi:flagellar biosynthesis/type III secretory pathway M-ring protein FliF/YscJ
MSGFWNSLMQLIKFVQEHKQFIFDNIATFLTLILIFLLIATAVFALFRNRYVKQIEKLKQEIKEKDDEIKGLNEFKKSVDEDSWIRLTTQTEPNNPVAESISDNINEKYNKL